MASYTYELKLKLDDFKPPKDVPQEKIEFGNIGDFWHQEKYDKLGGKFDEDMTGRLNDNLDALLVFAGLFSAINTSFILLGLTGLSSGPSDQTNHLLRLLLTNGPNSGLTSNDLDLPTFVPGRAIVRQNCLFVSSLGFSLIAAAGAVMARQWLQYYERTGQTGPIREQAMKRTTKYLGAKSWGLTHVVETLPTLLILSIALFAVGLVDYLWAVDVTVAIVIMVHVAVGFLGYGFTLIAGIVSYSCPFQTSISMFFRKLLYVDSAKELLAKKAEAFKHRQRLRHRAETHGHKLLHKIRDELSSVWKRGLGVVLDPFTAAGRFIRSTIPNAFKWTWSRVWKILSLQGRRLSYDHDDKIYTQSVIWMAETAPDDDNMLTIAQNIPLISDFESMQLMAPKKAFNLLLLRLHSSLFALRDNPTPDHMANAVTIAKAVGHVALAALATAADEMCEMIPKPGNLTWLENLPSSLESEELMIHLLSISTVFHWAKSQPPTEQLTEAEVVLRKGLRQSRRKGKGASTYLHHCILMAPINAKEWSDAKRQIDEIKATLDIEESKATLDTERFKADVAYVSCAARALSLTIQESPTLLGRPSNAPLSLERVKSAWEMRMENSFADTLLDVLEAFSSLYSSPPESIYSPLLLCQRQLLLHGEKLLESDDQILRQSQEADPLFLQTLHSALNSHIQLLFDTERAVFQPSIDSSILTSCQDQSIDFFNTVLLTPASQWHDVSPSQLEITARWAQRLGPRPHHLYEGILYRYFVHAVLGWPSTDRRSKKLASDGRIGGVLGAALRLYSGLCSSIAADNRWPVFQKYLRSMATGHVLLSFSIDWIPAMITWDAGLHRSDTPVLRSAFDPRRRLPSPSLAEDDSLVQEVEKVMFGANRMWNVKDNEATGSCLIWLAESIRVREAWSSHVDVECVIQLFIAMMKKQEKVAQDALAMMKKQEEVAKGAPIDMWSNTDVKAVGTLFLRAWEAKPDPPDEPSTSGSDIIEKLVMSRWMADNTIEAFTTWLHTFEEHGTMSIKEKDDDIVFIRKAIGPDISIKEKDDDIVFIRTAIGPELVQSYIERVKAENPLAFEKFGLDKASHGIVKGQSQMVVQETGAKSNVSRASHPSSSPVERPRATVEKKRPPPSLTQSTNILPLHTSDHISQAEGSTHISEKDRKIGT
ncbi:hypothetical protein FRB94_004477 [Tulasnella sp. JGI-2019a]|nr:hypothetical protein FRB93_005350 [Tulasnella sp. JGI-2019a]KAG9001881.1 hypothetical protein FRB94_004477 [Tulasnella sp. JGI-2019a]